jgi:hypothetical protein
MKGMKIIAFGVAAIFVLIFAGALFAQDVSVDYDKAFDFKTLKTFTVKIGTSWGNPLGEKRVLDAVEAALISKGWTKAADEASADAIVMIHGASQQKKDINTFYSGYGGYGYRGWGGMSTAHTTVSEYSVGTLINDIFDAKSKQLVFRGIAQDEISDKPEKNEKKIKKATEKMYKNFPPGSEKKN